MVIPSSPGLASRLTCAWLKNSEDVVFVAAAMVSCGTWLFIGLLAAAHSWLGEPWWYDETIIQETWLGFLARGKCSNESWSIIFNHQVTCDVCDLLRGGIFFFSWSRFPVNNCLSRWSWNGLRGTLANTARNLTSACMIIAGTRKPNPTNPMANISRLAPRKLVLSE